MGFETPELRWRPRWLLAPLTWVAWLAMVHGVAAAQFGEEYNKERQIHDRFMLRVGGFAASFNTSVRLDKSGLLGTTIEVEDQLGLDNRLSNLRVQGFYRLSRKHRLSYSVFAFNRNSRNMIDEEFKIGDEVFQLGAVLDSQLDTGFVRLSYSYSVINTGRFDFAFSGGLSIIDARYAVAAVGAITGPEDIVGDLSTGGTFTAPVPVIGNLVEVRLSRRLFYRGEILFFAIKTGSIEGSQIDGQLAIDWYPFRYVGFGVGYSFLRIEFDQNKSGERLTVDYRIDGPLVYLSYFF